MENKKQSLQLKDAYAQSPWCIACCACLADGPMIDAELIMLDGWCDEE